MSVNKWTDEEIRLLKEHYPDDSWDNILSLIHRKRGNIITKASHLHIVRNSSNKKVEWSEDEINLLKSVYKDYKIKDIQEKFFPNKTKDSIIKILGKLRLLKSRPWTESDNAFLVELYPTEDNKYISKLMDRTKDSIVNQAQQLGLKKKYYFTEEQIQFIKDNYNKLSDYEIGKVVGHNYKVVKDKRLRMGLRHDGVLDTGYRSITDLVRGRAKRWREESIAWCGNKCVITGKDFDEVHHLYGVNMMVKEIMDELDIPKDADVSNFPSEKIKEIIDLFDQKQLQHGYGLCMTKELHTLFHFEYGYGDNTPEQFKEFCKKHNFKLSVDITQN